MKSHSWKMIAGFAIMFIVGGLQSLKLQIISPGLSSGIDIVTPLLLFFEHAINGNS